MNKHIIKKIEELSLNALPSLDSEDLDGWLLRFSDGYMKRANSVNLLSNVEIPDHILLKKIEVCEKKYRYRNQQVIFKINQSLETKRLDDLLVARNYRVEGEVSVQLAPLKQMQQIVANDFQMVINKELTKEWLRAFAALSHVTEPNKVITQKILSQVKEKTAYFLLLDNEKNRFIACGRGVVEDEYIGLFDIVTNEAFRNQGHGKRLVSQMLAWGMSQGAAYAYLQVLENNEPAKGVYKSLGFVEEYRYWFRVTE